MPFHGQIADTIFGLWHITDKLISLGPILGEQTLNNNLENAK
jgi:hypothetical protein